MKSINSFSIDASQYDLISLSQNNDLPSNQAPYLALARYTMNLFEPNHEISIVILGSEEIDNFILRNQYYLNPIVSRNQTFDKNTKKLNDIDSYFDDDKFDKNESNLNNKISEYNTYYYNHNSNMLTKSIQVNNKRLFQSTVYRVALRACSQYPNGQQLCSTSHWSEKISPITSIKSNLISSKLKSFKDKITSWNLHKSSSSSSSSSPSPSSSSATASTSSSSLPIIFISLASCLIFFIILSTILGCILKCRKQQFHGALNNQYDVPICHNLNKSIINDNLSINSPIKSYLSNKTSNNSNNTNNNNLMKSQLSNYVLNIPNDDTQSPSNSSYGLSYSSTNGITSLNKSINQLPINNNITSTINKSMYLMNKDKNQQIKHDKMHIIDHFNQFVHDGTLELHRIPIPIEQFHEVIYQSRNNNYISLQHEFHTIEQISSTQYISTVHSNLDVNKSKNRYPNILAYDCTRVLLQLDSHQQYQSVEQSETLLGLDYINANYIDGYRKQKVYIATQAPLPNTFNSFWTMIWEQNTSVIVMLTKIIENGEVKCDQYWPNHGVLTFSDITVTHLETNELANYVMRSFEIRKDNEHRKIWHLQYTSWPDQEVPTYSTVFLMFLRRVGAITPNDCGPIVVHCSSGTGRTGVYIAISILLERMKTESVIDIFGLVNQLHMQRNYMIETQEQYQFIYTALYESITDGNTEVSARNLYTHLQHLSMLQTINTTNDYIGQLNNHLLTSLSTTSANNSINELSNLGGCNTMMTTSTTTTTTTIATTTTTSTTMPITNSLGITGFQLEFRKINKLSPNINFIQSKTGFVGYTPPGSPIHGYKLAVSCDVAKQSVNLSKNRLVSIVPFDWNRVTLCSIRGVNGSDYINASLIDGYLKKNAYIACQGPMISTVEDFWRMVWEKHSCLIVMLCSVKESGKEKCFTYWPEDKPSRYQFFVVDLTAQYTMSSHILREFKVTDTRDGESRTVRQLQYIRWNEQGLPQTSESLIDLIGHVHKTKEQYNYDGPITVHCSSGSGRTGLFITMCNVLERLRQESVVDMYQTVKLLRQQRVWMIQTEEQYRFCYTTTLDYLNSFDLCTQPQLLIQTNNNLQMNSPNLKIKMKSSHHLSDKTVLFELDKNYELRNHVVFK
ncbi:Receptor-type tyrosine-protein phosphatase F [Schistosoma japonicum]|uniref:protein-tyrosine-phosphatase n=1 Tax=Schistosoma japonicum TaxID=6182 RepID=A0A4Z2D3F1_SCHJA|nr:Receptor-type tyrosine-protein phosphatase F [Schistosoma japonicum]